MYFINHTCILCLNIKHLIFVNKTIFEDLKYVFPDCAINNTQPLYICKNCEVAIESFLIFKKRCLKSYYYWKKYSKALHNSSDDKTYGTISIEGSRKRKREDDNNLNLKEKDSENDDTAETTNKKICSVDENKETTRVDDKMIPELDLFEKNVDFDELSSWYDQNLSESEESLQYGTKNTGIISMKDGSTLVEDKEQICQICNQSITDIQDHLKFHMEQSISGCIVCKKKPSNLKGHIKRHMGLFDKFQCEICWKKFMYNVSLNEHMSTVHSKIREYKCMVCPKTFTDYNVYKNHEHEKVSNDNQQNELEKYKKYILLPNNVTEEDKKKFKQLMDNCRPATIPSFKCKVCNEQLSGDLKLVEKHVESHIGSNPNVCSICKYKNGKKYLIIDHLKRMHVGVKNLLCSICTKYFTTTSHLIKHIRLYHCESMLLHCALCQHGASSLSYMKRHVQVHLRDFDTCSVCKMQINNDNMKNHLQKDHKYKQCTHCDKLFDPKDFKEHVSSHTNLKICEVCSIELSHFEMKEHEKLHYFKCGECSKELKSQEILDKHYYLNHFKHTYCQLCNKNLNSADAAYQHYTQHINDNSISCLKCGKKFKNLYGYLSHMRKFQMARSFNCRLCKKRFSRPMDLRKHILTDAHMRNENDSSNELSDIDEENAMADDNNGELL